MNSVADTTPYAWPYDGLSVEKLALVICGADDGWAARTPSRPDADANLDALRSCAHACSIPTLLVLHDQAPVRCPVRPTSAPSSPLVPAGYEQTVLAAGIDGFYGSRLDAVLRRQRRSHLLLAGRGFEGPVHSTLRRANDRGYECLTIADACAALDTTLRKGSVSSIEMSGGIFGAVGTTIAVLDALRQTTSEVAP